MTTDALRREVKEFIIATLRLEDVQADSIDDAAPLFNEGLGLDSIDALELVSALEYKYKVSIPDEATGKKVFATVASLADFIAEHRASSAA
ncbi:MAG TPA: phosphopantetheine-binding protein [Myxococcota bacterium]|nr:phosphopantetheine-binding protein [Myxococcota bacterium]